MNQPLTVLNGCDLENSLKSNYCSVFENSFDIIIPFGMIRELCA